MWKLLRRWTILSHRWLGIGLSLLFFVWFATGITMVFAGGMPGVTPHERLEHLPPLDANRIRVSPADAAARAAGPPRHNRVLLLTTLGRPAYRFQGEVTVFADTGEPLEEIGEQGSLHAAARFMNVPESSLRYVGYLEQADQWMLVERRRLPVHKIAVNDAARTELYVSEATGEVVVRTTRGSRWFAWVAAIPHWLYFTPLRVNQSLWNRVVLWTSGLAAVSAVLGMALVFFQYRVRYVGLMRWHYVLGVVFGVLGVTWTVSGFFSMQPGDWSASDNRAIRIPQALAGGSLDLDAYSTGGVLSRILSSGDVKEVELRRLQDEPYFVVVRGVDRTDVVSAKTGETRDATFTPESIVRRVEQGYQGATVAAVDVLNDYDSYYYDRDRSAPLPVVRVKFADADATWVYVDTRASQQVAQFTRRQRIERWIYHGLHSLDFAWWYYNRPLWTIGIVTLCAGGTLMSAIGVLIGFKRLQRDVRRLVSAAARS